MAYTITDIKLDAYNYTERPDYTQDEKKLFYELAYCYEWYRAHPEDKEACMERMEFYINWYKNFTLREIKPKERR